MSLRIQRWLQAAVLAALALFIFQKFWSGTLFWYINDRFTLLTLGAALGLLLLAVMTLRPRPAQLPDSPDAAPPAAHDHDHAHGATRVSFLSLFIVALPAIVALLIPARPLGASAVANKGINAVAPLTAGGSANNIQPAKLGVASTDRTIIDWVRAFNYESNPAVFDGQLADVVGFVYHDSRLSAGQFLVARFTITCCVADAAAIGMVVTWPAAASLAGNSWVRVHGPVGTASLDGKALPLITATQVENVPEPTQPYLYP
jgi:putative membrane protein